MKGLVRKKNLAHFKFAIIGSLRARLVRSDKNTEIENKKENMFFAIYTDILSVCFA